MLLCDVEKVANFLLFEQLFGGFPSTFYFNSLDLMELSGSN